MAATDRDLLENWLERGDAEAFRQIALRHAPMVYSACRRILGDASLAEDVAQECFRRLASGRTTVRSLGAWLYCVATHLSLKQIRTDARRKEREVCFALAHENASTETSWNDVREHVDASISELPEDLRQALILHFIENRTHESIAQEIGVSRGTVTYRIRKGIEQVREKLRRRGVVIAVATLTSLLGERLEAAAAPASLLAGLGKMAIAGTGKAAAPVAGITGIVGGIVMTKKVIIAAVLAFGSLVLFRLSVPRIDEPPEVGRAAPAPQLAIPELPPVVQKGGNSTAKARGALPTTVEQPATGGIAGKVFDAETETPLAAATVVLHVGEVVAAVTRTGVDGVYRFTGLKPAVYGVGRDIWDKGLPPFREEETRSVTVEEAQVDGVDFSLVMGIRVKGLVVDEWKKPVPGAKVEARDRDDHHSLFIATSDDKGNFELVGFRQTRRLTMEAEKESAGLASKLFGPETLGPEGLSEIVLTLFRTGRISGRVVDPAGSPLASVLVNPQPITPEPNVQRMLGRGSDRTAEDGTFEVVGLAAGGYETLLLPEGRDQYYKPTPPSDRFELKAGEVIQGVALVLDLAPLARPSVVGRVLDDSEEPIDGAEIAFLGPGGYSGVSASSDKDGYFVAFALTDGTYTLRVTHRTHASVRLENIRPGPEAVKVVMPPCGSVHGQVLDAETGEPVVDFDLLYLDDYNRPFTGAELDFKKITDREGYFRIDKVHPGPVTVAVRASGYAGGRLEIPRLGSGETVNGLKLALSAGASLRGIVVDVSGAPVEGAGIIPGEAPPNQNPEVAVAARTDASGAFRLTGLSPDLKAVSVFHARYAVGSAPVSLVPGKEIVVTIRLEAGGILEGTVLHGERPWPGQVVRLHAGKTRTEAETRTSDTGRYRFENVDLGEARLIAIGSGELETGARQERWISQTVTVESGATVVTDFHFALGSTTVEGTVTEGGSPVTGINLQFYLSAPSGREFLHFRIQHDGLYRFEKVPPGPSSILLSIRDGRYRRVEFTIPPNGVVRKDIELTRGHSISGMVTGQIGEHPTVTALRGVVAVDAEDPLSSLRAFYDLLISKVRVEETGRFVLGGLDRGPYTIVATSGDLWAGDVGSGPFRMASTVVTAGQETEVRLVLGE